MKRKDKHLCPTDDSTTRIAIATNCCDGYHQTIAGALIKSKEWGEWYNYARKNMLFDVDETQEIDAMSDEHFKEFINFVKHGKKTIKKNNEKKAI